MAHSPTKTDTAAAERLASLRADGADTRAAGAWASLADAGSVVLRLQYREALADADACPDHRLAADLAAAVAVIAASRSDGYGYRRAARLAYMLSAPWPDFAAWQASSRSEPPLTIGELAARLIRWRGSAARRTR